MRRSEDRILTTHTGSLPRPPELTRLYVRRARGELVDAAELDRLGQAALRSVVRKQAEAGVDIGNNGEQQREGFFLHIRHRMSGFGGSWQRRTRADALRYPAFKQMMEQQLAAREAVSNMGPPKAIGEIRYLGHRGDRSRMRRLPGRARRHRHPFRRAVRDRAVARDHRRGDEERALRHRRGLSRRTRRGPQTRIRDDRAARLSVAARLPGPRSRTPPLIPGPAARRFPRLCRARRRDDQQGAWKISRATGCGCMSAGAITRGRTIATCRWPTSCRSSSRPMSAPSSSRSPIRGTPMSTASSKNCRSPTTRSSSPG